MSTKYLLPCSCGRQTAIETRQAGQTVACVCGKSIPAPTLLGMSALERAPAEPMPVATRHSSWGFKQGLRLVGMVLLVAGLALGIAIEVWLRSHPSRFDVIDPEQIQASYKSLPPARTWDVWQQWKQGLDRRTDQRYFDDVQKCRLGQLVALMLGVAGIAMIVAGGLRRRRPDSVSVRRPS